jgi:hypothetical protein
VTDVIVTVPPSGGGCPESVDWSDPLSCPGIVVLPSGPPSAGTKTPVPLSVPVCVGNPELLEDEHATNTPAAVTAAEPNAKEYPSDRRIEVSLHEILRVRSLGLLSERAPRNLARHEFTQSPPEADVSFTTGLRSLSAPVAIPFGHGKRP